MLKSLCCPKHYAMIYWLGLIMFLVAQMSEVLIWAIFQYDGLISQLPHQGMRDLLPGKKKAQCFCGCVMRAPVLFPTIQTIPLFSKSFQTVFSERKLLVISQRTSSIFTVPAEITSTDICLTGCGGKIINI